MYKIIITATAIFMLILMVAMGQTISKQKDTIRLMEKCLEYSDNVMDNNDIWDKDGSDYMSDYLELRNTLDSLFLDGFHKKYE